MVFQTHDLCGFRRKRFVCQFWRHLLILSSPEHDFTYKWNVVCRAIYSKYVLLTLGACALGTVVNAGHRCLHDPLASF